MTDKTYLFAGSLDPKETLEYYRKHSPASFQAEMVKFKGMPVEERLELLFWLTMHVNMSVSSCLVAALGCEDDQKH